MVEDKDKTASFSIPAPAVGQNDSLQISLHPEQPKEPGISGNAPAQPAPPAATTTAPASDGEQPAAPQPQAMPQMQMQTGTLRQDIELIRANSQSGCA